MRYFLPVALWISLALSSCGGGEDTPVATPPPEQTTAAAPTSLPLDDGVAIIAINANAMEEFPVAVFWAGSTGDSLTLPSGYWHLLVAEGDAVRRTADAIVSSGDEPLDLSAAEDDIPGEDGEVLAAFEALAAFTVLSHATYLSSLNVLSGGFDYAPFDPTADVDPAAAEQWALLNGEREALRSRAATAAEILGRERLVAAAPAPSMGLFDALKEKVEDPIKAQEAAGRASRDLALAFGRMTISQQREAFRLLTEDRGLEVDAEDAATFVEQLDAGEYDNVAAQARNFLQNHEDFFDFFDLRNIETARDEGAKLLIAGSEFYASAVKKVLVAKFPGIEKGWDAVEDLEQKLQRLLNPEIKPSDVAAILREFGYEVSDEEAESFVQTISYSIDLLKSQAGRANVVATPVGQSADGNWAVYNLAPIENLRKSALGIIVAEVDKVDDIRICTLSGGGLCEDANAKTTLKQAGGVAMILGPFKSEADAVQAFCDNIVPGTVKQAAIIGLIADMKFDGTWHAIYNAPSCE